VEQHDKKGIFSVSNIQDEWLIKQWLGFQAASQGPFFAQVRISIKTTFDAHNSKQIKSRLW
jgi:glutathione S-transferase